MVKLLVIVGVFVCLTIWVGFSSKKAANRTRKFEPTTARLERGRYIVEGIAHCFECHSEVDWEKPGGSLIYAVCSLEPEEGEAQVEAFLASRSDFRVEPAPQLADGVTPNERGWLRVLPTMLEADGGLDGFFTVHLVRAA